MRICIVAEGSYPYTMGGVSSWADDLIRSFPEHEFVILSVISSRALRGKFAYTLPDNVTEVHELYLQDMDWSGRGRVRMNREEYNALRSLLA